MCLAASERGQGGEVVRAGGGVSSCARVETTLSRQKREGLCGGAGDGPGGTVAGWQQRRRGQSSRAGLVYRRGQYWLAARG